MSILGKPVLSGAQTVLDLWSFAAGLNTDTINEYTLNSGVTIESVLIKDGLVDGVDVSAHDHSGAGQGGTVNHINLASIGTNTHAQIDTHIADTTIHFTEGSIDHTAIQNIGTNTHAQIDTLIAGLGTAAAPLWMTINATANWITVDSGENAQFFGNTIWLNPVSGAAQILVDSALGSDSYLDLYEDNLAKAQFKWDAFNSKTILDSSDNLEINSGSTLALTLDGPTQDATFASAVTATGGLTTPALVASVSTIELGSDLISNPGISIGNNTTGRFAAGYFSVLDVNQINEGSGTGVLMGNDLFSVPGAVDIGNTGTGRFGTGYFSALNLTGNITTTGLVDGVNISALGTAAAPLWMTINANANWITVDSSEYVNLPAGQLTIDLTSDTTSATSSLIMRKKVATTGDVEDESLADFQFFAWNDGLADYVPAATLLYDVDVCTSGSAATAARFKFASGVGSTQTELVSFGYTGNPTASSFFSVVPDATFSGDVKVTDNLLVGHTAAIATDGPETFQLQVHDTAQTGIATFDWSAGTGNMNWYVMASSESGTIGTYLNAFSYMSSGSNLGKISWQGDVGGGGNAFDETAAIFVECSGAWSATDRPTSMAFYTKDTVASGLQVALTLDSTQNATFTGVVNVSNATPIIKLLDTTVSAYTGSISVDNNNFNIQARDNSGTFIAQMHQMGMGASGATSHTFNIGGSAALSIDSSSDATFAGDIYFSGANRLIGDAAQALRLQAQSGRALVFESGGATEAGRFDSAQKFHLLHGFHYNDNYAYLASGYAASGFSISQGRAQAGGVSWAGPFLGVNLQDDTDATNNTPEIAENFGGFDAGAAISFDPTDGEIGFWVGTGIAGTELHNAMWLEGGTAQTTVLNINSGNASTNARIYWLINDAILWSSGAISTGHYTIYNNVTGNTTLTVESNDDIQHMGDLASSSVLSPNFVMRRNGGAASNGHTGPSIYWNGQNGSDVEKAMGRIYSYWDDVTNGSEDTRLVFSVSQGGATTNMLQIRGQSDDVYVQSANLTVDGNATLGGSIDQNGTTAENTFANTIRLQDNAGAEQLILERTGASIELILECNSSTFGPEIKGVSPDTNRKTMNFVSSYVAGGLPNGAVGFNWQLGVEDSETTMMQLQSDGDLVVNVGRVQQITASPTGGNNYFEANTDFNNGIDVAGASTFTDLISNTYTDTSPDSGRYLDDSILTVTGVKGSTADGYFAAKRGYVSAGSTGGGTGSLQKVYNWGLFGRSYTSAAAHTSGTIYNISGIYADARFQSAGDCYQVFGGQFSATDNGATGTVTELIGTRGSAIKTGSQVATYVAGGWFASTFNGTGATAAPSNLYGVVASTTVSSGVTDVVANAYGMKSYMANEDATASITSAYLFHGQYGGAYTATNAWGWYIVSDVPSYTNGDIYVGTTTGTIDTANFGFKINRSGRIDGSVNTNGAGVSARIYGNAGSLIVRGDGDCENTNGSYTAISDVNLKENITDASSQWDDIKQIQIRNFNLIEYPDRPMIGVVAQEVEQVSPGLVKDTNEGYKVVKQSILYMKAVKALQEAMERIEQLEAQVYG